MCVRPYLFNTLPIVQFTLYLELLLCSVCVGIPSLPDVATEAVILAPSVREEDRTEEGDLGEFSISRVINRQFSGELQRVFE